jgi:hypothetical protein
MLSVGAKVSPTKPKEINKLISKISLQPYAANQLGWKFYYSRSPSLSFSIVFPQKRSEESIPIIDAPRLVDERVERMAKGDMRESVQQPWFIRHAKCWYPTGLTYEQIIKQVTSGNSSLLIDTWDRQEAIKCTKEALNNPNVKFIFEPAFEFTSLEFDLYARADVLERVEKGWILKEAKSFCYPEKKLKFTNGKNFQISSSPSFLSDIAFQSYVISKSINIAGIKLIHVNQKHSMALASVISAAENACVVPTEDPLFLEIEEIAKTKNGNQKHFEIQEEVNRRLLSIESNIGNIIREISKKKSENVVMGDPKHTQCKYCQYQDKCLTPTSGRLFYRQNQKVTTDKKFYDYEDTRKINPNLLLDPVVHDKPKIKHYRILKSEKTNKVFIDFASLKKCRSLIDSIFFDIETNPQAIPSIPGIGPWASGGYDLPFACSVSYVKDGKVVENRWFYHRSLDDPKPTFHKFLIHNLNEDVYLATGFYHCNNYPIVHWGSAENTILTRMNEKFGGLDPILSRLYNLQKVVEQNMYYPKFNRRFSLKTVGPAITGKRYTEDLPDGMEVGLMWAADPTNQETENLIRKYCDLDVAQTVGVARGRDGWTFFRKRKTSQKLY